MINFLMFICATLTVVMVATFFGFFVEEGLVGFRQMVEVCGQ